MRITLTDTLIALVNVGAHWHSGGGSRGYRLMCLAARALKRRGHHSGGYQTLDTNLTRRQRIAERILIARYAESL